MRYLTLILIFLAGCHPLPNCKFVPGEIVQTKLGRKCMVEKAFSSCKYLVVWDDDLNQPQHQWVEEYELEPLTENP